MFLSGGISFLILKTKLDSQLQHQKNYNLKQRAVIDSIRSVSLSVILENVLRKIDDELKLDPDHQLSEETIKRVIELTYSAKPYLPHHGDSNASKLLSPERGYLLMQLTRMNIDSASYDMIIATGNFAYADLPGADLKNLDLSQINLNNANLKDANLSGSDLTNADMTYANLWGANLKNSSLLGTNFRRADLQWADLDSAILQNANLNSANVTSAKFRNTNWKGATMIWANATGVLMNNSNLDSVSLIGTNFENANLSYAVLSNCNLTRSNLAGATLSHSDMSAAELKLTTVDQLNWLSQFDKWLVKGSKEIQSKYTVSKNGFNRIAPYIVQVTEEIKANKKN